jgi:hypothetical protein
MDISWYNLIAIAVSCIASHVWLPQGAPTLPPFIKVGPEITIDDDMSSYVISKRNQK